MTTPDKWCILKINGPDPHYRVFGSWFGDYFYGDSWRMNSGIIRVSENNETYLFHGHSGSCYKCNKKSYGHSSYGYTIISKYINSGIAKLLNDQDWIKIDWIIKEKENG